MDQQHNFIRHYLDFDSQYQKLMIERLISIAQKLAKSQLIKAYLPNENSKLDKAQTFECVTRAISTLVDSGSPEAGLLLGKSFTIEDFGLFNIAISNCSNLDEALKLICRYCSQVEFGLSLIYQISAKQSYLQINTHISDISKPWYVEDALFGCLNVLRGLAEDKFILQQIDITTSTPSAASYFEDLACKVNFQQPHTRIYFAPFNDQPSSNNQQLNEVAIRWMLSSNDNQDELLDRIYKIMFEHIGSGRLSQDWLAKQLQTSTATLKRKLARLNTSFSKIQSEIRMLLSYDYLLNTDLSVLEIGQILDYTDSGNFCRAFKKWFGCSPHQFRKMNRV
ncbi:AraC family transcriptional regulator [Paraferrimonas sp. SM1919]|uniref:AraC family transcriptional regulator n=1 Tax=Paraferrimonas sp. SM1919 TaxID=2662263 RepID=UPI0013CFCAD3|nr:AraC family transcriptional regulator [Paraferrimonas sp. SM1919]